MGSGVPENQLRRGKNRKILIKWIFSDWNEFVLIRCKGDKNMSKARKIIMGVVFALIVVMGVRVGSSNVNAASTKDFKGNLNATYKNSEWKSKITFKKINTKKVSVKVVISGTNQGSYSGTITSGNTIKMKLDGGEAINLKWKGKSSFTAKPTKGFSSESVQMARLLCNSLNNTKYTQVKKSSTVYYNSYAGYEYTNASVKLKGNKLIVKGNLKKGTKQSVGEVKGNTSVLKKATRTFKLAKNFKAYGYVGALEKYDKFSKSELRDIGKGGYRGGKNGLTFILTVKNGKATRIDFYS